MSVMVFVQPEGRWFGYFEDGVGGGSGNSSREYLWVNADQYDIHMDSQYSKNLQSSLPTLLTSTTPSTI